MFQTEKSEEFMTQKIATIRMMYEQVSAECQVSARYQGSVL